MLSITCLICVLTSCSSNRAKIPTLLSSLKSEADIAGAVRGDLYQISYYDGRVVPDVTEVQAEKMGTFSEFLVSIGDRVSKGDVLAVMFVSEDSMAEKEENPEDAYRIEGLELDIEIAKTQLEILIKENAKEQEIRLQELEVESMELSLSQEKEKLQLIEEIGEWETDYIPNTAEKYEIKAPCDGTISYRTEAVKGDIVPAYSVVASIAGSHARIETSYLSNDRLAQMDRMYTVHNGKRINLIPLSEVNSAVPKTQGSISSYFIPETTESSFTIGDYMPVYVISDLQENVIYIPVDALKADKEGYFVYVWNEGKKKTPVEIGLITVSYVEIVSGVQEGDQILVTE
ncbi:MAG: Membrane-fusion protein [Herbinix sp.]|nr:Membrane-fusion protein [Herbinix sp.]